MPTRWWARVDVDLLVGAGVLGHLSFSMVTLEAFGLAPNVRRAIESGRLAFTELTGLGLLVGLEAQGRGVPFLPYRGPFGSDIQQTTKSKASEQSLMRILRKLQKIIVVPQILNWLRDVARQTRSSDLSDQHIAECVVGPLTSLRDNLVVDEDVRMAAGKALERMERNRFRPTHVLQHSDLWWGNVIAKRWFGKSRPLIVDWGASTNIGFPFYDLCTFAMSTRLSRLRFKMEIARHCSILKCDRTEVAVYCLCALGLLGQSLGFFPLEAYAELCRDTCEFLTKSNFDV